MSWREGGRGKKKGDVPETDIPHMEKAHAFASSRHRLSWRDRPHMLWGVADRGLPRPMVKPRVPSGIVGSCTCGGAAAQD